MIQVFLWLLLIGIGLFYISETWIPYYDRFQEWSRRLAYEKFSFGNGGEGRRAHFFELSVKLYALMARADGVVSEDEIDAIERFFSHRLHFTPDQRKKAIQIFRTTRDSNETFEQVAVQLNKLMGRQRGALSLTLHLLNDLALADGIVHGAERKQLEFAKQLFNVPYRIRYAAKHTRFERDTNTSGDDWETWEEQGPYSVLGLENGASLSEVKKAYRKLVKECHPDRMARSGVSEEYLQASRERFMEIQKAYEAITGG